MIDAKENILTARVQVLQAKAVLSLWIEINARDDETNDLIGAILTLISGVPEALENAEHEIVRIMQQAHHHAEKPHFRG